jgi:hypothetical protein
METSMTVPAEDWVPAAAPQARAARAPLGVIPRQVSVEADADLLDVDAAELVALRAVTDADLDVEVLEEDDLDGVVVVLTAVEDLVEVDDSEQVVLDPVEQDWHISRPVATAWCASG